MTVERDIAGFAFPFAAGIALAAVFFREIFSIHPAAILPTLCLWGISLGILLNDCRHRLNASALWILIIILALTSGMLSGGAGACLSISETPGNGAVSQIAHRFYEGLRHSIASIPFQSGTASSIVTALITGDKSALSSQTVQAFRVSGASHILALSGLHLGIIYAIVRLCLSCLGNSPRAKVFRSLSAILICAFYSIATGASPSIIRALIFIIAAEIATLTGRHKSIRQILFVSLLIQLALNPSDIKSIGFQLSYAAMFAIAYIFPSLERLWPKPESDSRGFNMTIKGLRWIWNCAAMSISCQIATAPLALYHFGTFPKYFLLTNIIALPLVGIIIPSCIAVIALHTIGICPDVMIRATEYLIVLMDESLEIIASM